MKREHITLPALQLAAAAFFAKTAVAEIYCVDQASKIVATNNCNNADASAKFSFVKGPLGMALGDAVSRTMKVNNNDGSTSCGNDGLEGSRGLN
ncbi:hypothetical protein P885DRAFT_76799 [Corynascus similis CBS 632.67]